ncbi:hypothetical protein GE09DRAFT_1245347 [Coniochaeta sp. 2T2.1]|nr:hypothetical protein GE09DRAFT_1245347 [Coniochaeta sp. 2T2.1]
MYNDEYTCGTCWKTFPAGWKARDNHCDATGHQIPRFECDRCERYFASESAREAHMWAKNHFDLECNICDETWPNEEDVKEHEVEEHFYCADCDRTFMNLNNIQQHLRSRIHRGTDIMCPFCNRGFATATGVAHHIETGACPNAQNIHRDEMYKFIRSKDPQGLISKKLIGWTGSASYQATDRTWNGQSYECYFCHREFGKLQSLQQHLSSPIHQQNLYHCPGANCRKDFASLAAIINHFESESCGFMRFEKVQQRFGDIIAPGRRLQF